MKQVFLSTRKTTTMALVKAPHDDAKSALTPLLFAASLDRSGSMGTATGEMKNDKDTSRWEVVVECLGQAIDCRRKNGHPDDSLLVIAFNENAEVVVKPIKLSDWKEENFAQLMTLQPTGYTNISGGDALMASEIQKYLATFDEDSTKPIVVTLNLTDGFANAGLIRSKDIAAAKNKQTQELIKGGYLTVNGFYAISDGADPAVSSKCAKMVGSNTSLWKHVKTNDFPEFSGEVGLLTSLSQLVTTVKFKDEAAIVLKGSWCPLAIAGAVEELVVPVPLLGTLLTECLQQSQHSSKDDEKKDAFVVDVAMLEHVKQCLVGGGGGDDDNDEDEKRKKEEEPSFRSASSVLVEEQHKMFLHQLTSECNTFTKIVTQLHGADEYSQVVTAVVVAMKGYKKTLESKEMGFTALCGDMGILRQMSYTSQAACEMSVNFQDSYKKRYKRAKGRASAGNSFIVLPLPLPLSRSPAKAFDSAAFRVTETPLSQQGGRRVRKRCRPKTDEDKN
jgi:hypothetical protein